MAEVFAIRTTRQRINKFAGIVFVSCLGGIAENHWHGHRIEGRELTVVYVALVLSLVLVVATWGPISRRIDRLFFAPRKQEAARRRYTKSLREAARDLEKHIGSVLEENLHRALDSEKADGPVQVQENAPLSYHDVMPKSLWYFARYFAWAQVVRNREPEDCVLDAIKKSHEPLADWAIGGVRNGMEPLDKIVLAENQEALGEAVTKQDADGFSVMKYLEFARALDDNEKIIAPLRDFLDGIAPDTPRADRLFLMRDALRELRETE